MRVAAVVGSWPEPFAQRSAGAERLPVRIVCAAREVPCDEAAERLADEGVNASVEPGHQPRARADEAMRVLIGPWSELARDPVARSSPTARRRAACSRASRGRPASPAFSAYDVNGAEADRFGPGAGLVAALREGEDPPTWVVAGTDDAGVEAAVELLGAGPLADRYAVAVAATRPSTLCRSRGTGDGGPLAARLLAASGAAAALERDRRRHTWPRSRSSPSSTQTRSSSPARGPRSPSPGCAPGPAGPSQPLRWGAWLGVFVIVGQRARVAAGGHDPVARAGTCPSLGQIDISGEALVEGGVLALRIVVVSAAFAVCSACVDPDRVLRLVRPIARRSALTATLITRLVPLAAADSARLREAAALRGPAARRSAARRSPGAWSPARSTARSTSRRRSSCAATRCGPPRRGRARPRRRASPRSLVAGRRRWPSR